MAAAASATGEGTSRARGSTRRCPGPADSSNSSSNTHTPMSTPRHTASHRGEMQDNDGDTNDTTLVTASSSKPPERVQWRVDTYCRVRPLLPHQVDKQQVIFDVADTGAPADETEDGSGTRVMLRVGLPPGSAPYIWNNRRQEINFQFTEVFRADSTQEVVFSKVASDVVDAALAGYNGTVFAYGQTGSGKTYTMTGGDTFGERGLIPRVISEVYKEVQQRSEQRKYRILVSYMEIYKENVYDLLDASQRNKPLDEWTKVQLMDDEDGEMHLKNLKLYEACTEEDALNLLFLGNWNRITSETPMNEASSRSHCIFTLRVHGEPCNGRGTATVGKLNLVDLAGSERMYKTDTATQLKTRIEGKYINLSLHYLEQVIVALQEKSRLKGTGGWIHIPYRNSAMTSILKDSLGGNCRTVFIVTVNTEVDHLEESISTCRFASRCAQLTMDVQANEVVDPEELAASLQAEVARLRTKLQAREAQLNEYKTKMQDESMKDQPRSISADEKRTVAGILKHFLRSSIGSEDSEWVYNLERPLLEDAFHQLKAQYLKARQPMGEASDQAMGLKPSLLRTLSNSRDSRHTSQRDTVTGTPLSAFASIASSDAGTPDRRQLSSTRGSDRSGSSGIDRVPAGSSRLATASSRLATASGMTTPTALMYDGGGSRGGGGGDRGGGRRAHADVTTYAAHVTEDHKEGSEGGRSRRRRRRDHGAVSGGGGGGGSSVNVNVGDAASEGWLQSSESIAGRRQAASYDLTPPRVQEAQLHARQKQSSHDDDYDIGRVVSVGVHELDEPPPPPPSLLPPPPPLSALPVTDVMPLAVAPSPQRAKPVLQGTSSSRSIGGGQDSDLERVRQSSQPSRQLQPHTSTPSPPVTPYPQRQLQDLEDAPQPAAGSAGSSSPPPPPGDTETRQHHRFSTNRSFHSVHQQRASSSTTPSEEEEAAGLHAGISEDAGVAMRTPTNADATGDVVDAHVDTEKEVDVVHGRGVTCGPGIYSSGHHVVHSGERVDDVVVNGGLLSSRSSSSSSSSTSSLRGYGGSGEYYHRLLTRGDRFVKRGRNGRRHERFVRVSEDLQRIMWRKLGESEMRDSMPLSSFHDITAGGGANPDLSFTLHGDGRHLTLEIECPSAHSRNVGGNNDGSGKGSVAQAMSTREEWMRALEYLIVSHNQLRHQRMHMHEHTQFHDPYHQVVSGSARQLPIPESQMDSHDLRGRRVVPPRQQAQHQRPQTPTQLRLQQEQYRRGTPSPTPRPQLSHRQEQRAVSRSPRSHRPRHQSPVRDTPSPRPQPHPTHKSPPHTHHQRQTSPTRKPRQAPHASPQRAHASPQRAHASPRRPQASPQRTRAQQQRPSHTSSPLRPRRSEGHGQQKPVRSTYKAGAPHGSASSAATGAGGRSDARTSPARRRSVQVRERKQMAEGAYAPSEESGPGEEASGGGRRWQSLYPDDGDGSAAADGDDVGSDVSGRVEDDAQRLMAGGGHERAKRRSSFSERLQSIGRLVGGRRVDDLNTHRPQTVRAVGSTETAVDSSGSRSVTPTRELGGAASGRRKVGGSYVDFFNRGKGTPR